jgi:branched-subunit amino acid aminotransferase/4-amino-4-deoxychorismate lyase
LQSIHSYFISPGTSDDPEDVLANDKNFQKGKAVYTSIRTYEGKAFRLDEHLLRLKNSARLLGFEILYPVDQIKKAINNLISINPNDEQFLRITATPKNLVLISRHLEIDESIYEGVSTSTTDLQRTKVKAKTFPSKEMKEVYTSATDDGHHDVLILNADGNITEGSRSNVLWIKDDTLYWCPDALSGITQIETFRCAVELFKDGALKHIEEAPKGLPITELHNIDEIFLTQTSRGIIPVTRVDDHQISDGKPGLITKALRVQFNRRILDFVV